VDYVDWFKVNEDGHVMNYVLESADLTMEKYMKGKSFELYEFKCILFQLLFGIYVAQEECEFVHNDLHMKNVLLRKPKTESCIMFKMKKNEWYTSGHIVKITDFGLSRIKSNDTVLFDPKTVDKEVFNYMTDVEKVFSELKNVKIKEDSWVTQQDIDEEKKKQTLIQTLQV